MNKKMILPGLVLLVVGIAVAGYLLTKDDNSSKSANTSKNASTDGAPSDTTQSTNNDKADQDSSTATPNSQASIITYTDNGFSPTSLTVEAGSTIRINNTSSSSIQFDSDPHPDHTDDPELNVGLIPAGESKTITVTTKGSHGYHNHLDSSMTGTLVVQ